MNNNDNILNKFIENKLEVVRYLGHKSDMPGS